MDINGALQAVYDPANQRLSVTQVAGSVGAVRTGNDANGVINLVYDAATRTLRVILV